MLQANRSKQTPPPRASTVPRTVTQTALVCSAAVALLTCFELLQRFRLLEHPLQEVLATDKVEVAAYFGVLTSEAVNLCS